MDQLFSRALWLSLGLLCAVILIGRGAQMFNAHMRHVSMMGSARQDKQLYWQHDQGRFWPNFKKYFLYAPFWKKRHNREIKLSSAINFGTLPSRFHGSLLIFYVLSNIVYCCALNYRDNNGLQLAAEIRGRTGTLATVNMIPLIILASRNNPLIKLLRVSFDTYNLLHRWIGRIVVLEAVAHTMAWGANQVMVHHGKWNSIGHQINASKFLQWGAAGTFTMLFMLLHSPSAIRHAAYETFKYLHIVAACVTILGVYMHLKVHALYQVVYLELVIAIWVLERATRLGLLFYRNFSRKGLTTITVDSLGEAGDACRVTIDLPRPLDPKPGSHVYVYLPSISLFQSHPFSIAWSEKHRLGSDLEEKLPSSHFDLDNPPRFSTSISLVIHKRTGMTATLNEKAHAARDGRLILKGAVEGPYGGLESLHSYGSVLMFAGGIGITHQISHIRDLVSGFNAGTIATRKIILVWIVRNTEDLNWVRPWMDKILQMPGRRDILKILLFVTRPKSTREFASPSARVQMFHGRPQPEVILRNEVAERTGAMAVTVCGPGALADSVRHETRRWIPHANIDFIEESFTW